ncbi:hypothetical protein E3N88_32184 [Mikania micrantha]|uniref:Thioredoxin domain-containing protein n=1 Tax=Mikania micrantha TaxID=192012 RepID=A0A5N6M7Q0_9ASTR|nr:hypothetical protein E3N88_32184 [Mikania micrantha]
MAQPQNNTALSLTYDQRGSILVDLIAGKINRFNQEAEFPDPIRIGSSYLAAQEDNRSSRDLIKRGKVTDKSEANKPSKIVNKDYGTTTKQYRIGTFMFCYASMYDQEQRAIPLSPSDDDESANHPQFAGGKVTLITTKDTWNQKLSEAKSQGKIVIANFSASWCGPCKSVAPYYIELSEKHSSLMFLTIDVDELTELSTQWDVKATPTFFFLRDGQQIDKVVGANKPELQEKITAIADSQVPSDQK